MIFLPSLMQIFFVAGAPSGMGSLALARYRVPNLPGLVRGRDERLCLGDVQRLRLFVHPSGPRCCLVI